MMSQVVEQVAAPAVQDRDTPARDSPRRSESPARANAKQYVEGTPPGVSRPCAEHNFLTDVADVRQMEKGLLVLLEDFHKGKLQVFGKGCTFEQMDQVREQQERLARLHFDLDAQQQIQNIDNEDRNDATFRNIQKLVDNLDDLSNTVHRLKSGTVPTKSATPSSPKQKKSGGKK